MPKSKHCHHHLITTNVIHLLCACLPLQIHWGLHKGNGAFFLTVTLKWYWLWYGLTYPGARLTYPPALLYPPTPAVVALERRPPHGSPSLCVPPQAPAARAGCTGRTSLSAKVKHRRWDQYDQMRYLAKTKPSQAFHLPEENYMNQLWQGNFERRHLTSFLSVS